MSVLPWVRAGTIPSSVREGFEQDSHWLDRVPR
jgi:hypothetical protein